MYSLFNYPDVEETIVIPFVCPKCTHDLNYTVEEKVIISTQLKKGVNHCTRCSDNYVSNL